MFLANLRFRNHKQQGSYQIPLLHKTFHFRQPNTIFSHMLNCAGILFLQPIVFRSGRIHVNSYFIKWKYLPGLLLLEFEKNESFLPRIRPSILISKMNWRNRTLHNVNAYYSFKTCLLMMTKIMIKCF